MTGQSHTKGAAFRAFAEWSQREFGIERTYEIHRQLPAHLKRLVNPAESAWGLLVSSWYPDELPNRMLELMLAPLDEPARLRALREGTRYVMQKTFRGIYRPLVQLLVTPERWAKLIQKVWRMNYDTGIVTWTYERPGLIHTELRGWEGHHPHRCEINRVSEELILEMLGGTSVKSTRVKCLERGDDRCGSVVTWTPA